MTKAGGGGGGTSAYNSDACTLQTGSSASRGVDPYIEVEYTSASATGTQVTTTTTVSGAQAKTLRLKRDTVGIHTVQCKISHPTAVNNPASSSTRENYPIWTDKVEFSALSAVNLTRSNLTYEITKDGSEGNHKTETVNLFVQPMTLAGSSTSPDNVTRNIHVYPPEEDIQVKITMSAAAGQGFNGNKGGQGGVTIFTYTLLKNTEYTFKLGCTVEPTASIGRGGAGAYFYEGGRLLVCCGGGGASGWEERQAGDSAVGFCDGGHGGGAGIAGLPGNGSDAGAGGRAVRTGELEAQGLHFVDHSQDQLDKIASVGYATRYHHEQGYRLGHGQGTPGGKVASCTQGIYWKNQGVGPCETVGVGKFKNALGKIQYNTSSLVRRGYKADNVNYGYRHNGGNSTVQFGGTFVGGGGAGAYGGTSCSPGNFRKSGGGGGSGYTNGSVNILHTQVGGNINPQASALIELLTSDNEKWVNVVRGV